MDPVASPTEKTMDKPSLLTALPLVLLLSCSGEDRGGALQNKKPESPKSQSSETKTAEGILEYFPQHVMSREAWLGHEYKVNGTPIRPTSVVPSEALRKMVGTKVKIEGVWNPGKQWEPTEEDSSLQNPVFPEGEIVIRGAGIEASSAVYVED